MTTAQDPIGTPGTPWGDAERALWRSRQSRRRSYADDVLGTIDRLRGRFDVFEYGRLEYAPDGYPLLAIRSRDWNDALPCVLGTGGVHGYETSGVRGARRVADRPGADHRSEERRVGKECGSACMFRGTADQ